MVINANINIQYSTAQVLKLIADDILKNTGLDVADKIEIQYDGNYDTTNFDGVSVSLTPEEFTQYLTKK